MMYIVIARWSRVESGNAYFGPFDKEQADEYLAYLLEGQPQSAHECFFLRELSAPGPEFYDKKNSRHQEKLQQSQTAVSASDIKLDQEFLHHDIRYRRCPEGIEPPSCILVVAEEGGQKGKQLLIPKVTLVEPL